MIVLYLRDLWGIIATGEILRLGGGDVRMSSQSTTRAWLFATFSAISVASCAIARGSLAETCGPRQMAASISCLVQFRPVLAGQPPVAYDRRWPAAGW